MNKRPVLYSSASTLSFVGSGIAFLTFLLVAIFYEFVSRKIIGITNELSMDGTSRFYFILLSAFHALSFSGVVALWKYRKNGFFLYLISQLSILFLPLVFLSRNAFSITNTVFTIVFVSIYFSYYRWIIKCNAELVSASPTK